MEGKERREKILMDLSGSTEPITGTELAKRYDVSRQIIVQDIALLRAQGLQIISTSEGYLVYKIKDDTVKRVIQVKHFGIDIEDELMTIIDLGGTILDVIVVHPVYGEISVNMMLSSRSSVERFMKKLEDNDFVPLLNLTKGDHYHTIEAKTEEILNEIVQALVEKGYVVSG